MKTMDHFYRKFNYFAIKRKINLKLDNKYKLTFNQ